MLGLDYSVNLHEMVSLNYDKQLVKIKALLKSWSKRNMTPIVGGNCVFKSLVISQLNHLITTLPNPGENCIQKLNTLMFNFIWDCAL